MTSLPAASAYMEIRRLLLDRAPVYVDVDRLLDEFEAGVREDERRRLGHSEDTRPGIDHTQPGYARQIR